MAWGLIARSSGHRRTTGLRMAVWLPWLKGMSTCRGAVASPPFGQSALVTILPPRAAHYSRLLNDGIEHKVLILLCIQSQNRLKKRVVEKVEKFLTFSTIRSKFSVERVLDLL